MNEIITYKAHRKDSREDGEVLFIDFENNQVGIKFFTHDKKYFYEKTYDINDKDIVLTQCK